VAANVIPRSDRLKRLRGLGLPSVETILNKNVAQRIRELLKRPSKAVGADEPANDASDPGMCGTVWFNGTWHEISPGPDFASSTSR